LAIGYAERAVQTTTAGLREESLLVAAGTERRRTPQKKKESGPNAHHQPCHCRSPSNYSLGFPGAVYRKEEETRDEVSVAQF